jgi:MFS family permease
MIKKGKFPKIYYGWWMNVITGILTGLAQGYSQSFSVFFKPIATELGLSRAATSIASSMARLEGGIQAPITGGLADKFGAKWVLVAGALLMGSGLLLMCFVVHSAWAYYIAWGVVIATGNNLGFTIAVDKVLTNWFVKKRGLSFGVRFAILGIMQVAVIPVISWLTITYGWRTASFVWAMVIFAGIPFTLYFVKPNRPESYGLLPDGAKADSTSEAGTDTMIAKGVAYAASVEETEFTLRQAMKTSSFWMLTILWCALGIVSGGFTIHCIPFLTDRGIEPSMAASMMSMMIFFTIPSRFFFAFFADHVKKEHQKYLLTGSFLLMTVGITAFLLYQTSTMVYVFLALWGLGTGGTTPLSITMRGRYFGRKAYGSIQGTSQLIAAPIALISPVFAGWIYDTTGSYINAFIIFAAITVSAAFLSCLIRVPKPPAQAADISRLA